MYASGVPSLLFSPKFPLPDGREVNHYTYRTFHKGAMEPGEVADGWEGYLVPVDFIAEECYIQVDFTSGEQVFWSCAK